jgi:hypothetical protein
MVAFAWFANVATHKSIPRKVMIQGMKVLDFC